MLRADMMVRAIDAALEDAEIVFGRVGMPEAAAHIFVDGMVDGAMPGKLRTELGIDRAFVWS